MKIILPKANVPPSTIFHPIFFLIGPDKGGADWQLNATHLIRDSLNRRGINEFFVVIPKHYDSNHPLYTHRVGDIDTEVFPRQVDWERRYIKIAAGLKGGKGTHPVTSCAIAWLPGESKMHPRNDGLPYAMDTRREVAEALGWLMFDRSLRIIIGGERGSQGFPGLSTLERCFELELADRFTFYESLEATVETAIELALNQ